MGGRGSKFAPIIFVLGVSTAVVMAVFTIMAWTPRHRAEISITDPADSEIPADYDVLALRGWIAQDTYEIRLVVEGTIREGLYIVEVVGRAAGTGYLADHPHIYSLSYSGGVEENYGVPAEREGDRLSLSFPLTLLLDGAFIVGLEASAMSFDSQDFVKEVPRAELRVESMGQLPFDPIFFAAASVVIGLLTLLIFLRLLRL